MNNNTIQLLLGCRPSYLEPTNIYIGCLSGPMSECTSMELHTPHSTEVSCDGKENVFSFTDSGKILKDVDSVSDLAFPGRWDRQIDMVIAR